MTIHFQIINPHQAYTMQAPDLEIAGVAIALLGEGGLGLEQIGGDRSAVVPMFLEPGSSDAWFTRQFDRGFKATLDHVTATRLHELVAALASCHVGTPADKRAFDEAATKCPNEEALAEMFLADHDAKVEPGKPNISRGAWALAVKLTMSVPQGTVQ